MNKQRKKYNFTYTANFSSKIIRPKNLKELKSYLTKDFTIVGNLRSYGDTFIGTGKHISLSNFNKILNLNLKKKIIEIESGASLAKMNEEIFKKGLILKCMPGCKYVSIGGMISNNISGKLLFQNNLKNFIISIKLINNKNQIVECSRNKNKKLFNLSIGGKGRTGPIISAKLKLEKLNSSEISQELFMFNSYKNFFYLISNLIKFQYAVCWIDFTKKNFDGIIFAGSHKNNKNIINNNYFDFKISNLFVILLSFFVKKKLITQIFNFFFKLKNKTMPKNILSLNNFFFPQNKILNWNEFFKKEGFIQFQIYFKINNLENIIDTIKKEIYIYKIFSNFAIIKFHSKNKNKFEKLSLSLDFPVKDNFVLIKRFINKLVSKYDLEVELSKDIALYSLNPKTLKNNEVFMQQNIKYINKNFKSRIFKRLNRNE